MQSMQLLGWVSILIALSILGMGGAPIAEYFELPWLMLGLQWLSYVSVGLLSVATLLIGGLGIYHGILTVMGKEIGTVSAPATMSPVSGQPLVQSPKPITETSADGSTEDAQGSDLGD